MKNNNFVLHCLHRWVRGNPYLHLLGRYLHCYLPQNTNCSPAARDSPDHNVEFLQLAIDYWIDTVLIVKHDFDRVALCRDEYLKQLNYTSHSSPSTSTALSMQSSSPQALSRAGYNKNGTGRMVAGQRQGHYNSRQTAHCQQNQQPHCMNNEQ